MPNKTQKMQKIKKMSQKKRIKRRVQRRFKKARLIKVTLVLTKAKV
jgi:hypothetical protein